MAADDFYPTCYGLEPIRGPEPVPEPEPEPEPEPAPEPTPELAPEPTPEPAPEPTRGLITVIEEVFEMVEGLEPKTIIRRGAFKGARMIRKKLR